MDEVEAVAQAIEDQLTAEDGWMVGTPALSSMCHDFAQAAAAVIAADRAGLVAEVERLREMIAKLAGYAGHDDDCQIVTHGVWSDPIPCTCGYSEIARAALKDTRHEHG